MPISLKQIGSRGSFTPCQSQNNTAMHLAYKEAFLIFFDDLACLKTRHLSIAHTLTIRIALLPEL